MRAWKPVSALLSAALLLPACTDRPAFPTAGGTVPLAARGAGGGERLEESGCAIWGRDEAGVARGIAIPRRMLPFVVRPVRREPSTGRSMSRAVSITAEVPGRGPVAMECLLDESLTAQDIATALRGSKPGRWRSVVAQLQGARPLPDSGKWQGGPAARQTSGQSAPPRASHATMSQSDDACVMVEVYVNWYDSEGRWNSLTITFKVCFATGGGGAYQWMVNNGYTQNSYVVVDADKYNVPQTDSVGFTADIVTNSFEIPYLLGWTWTPASGVADRWTVPCSDNDYSCRTKVHGSGRMAFDVIIGGQVITGTVQVNAFVPEDVGITEGDTDFPDGPGVIAGTQAISARQSTAVLADAVRMGEWVYTQGCARCGNGPFTEPPVNIPAQYGDCTDFVWAAVKHVLGSSWPHAKISTRMFNSFGPTQLARHGYVQVDSAVVREGDIVVNTRTSGCLCGHAGVFTGWGAGGHPIGHANNGTPATPDRPNLDRPTGKYNFKARPGYQVRFFRPIT